MLKKYDGFLPPHSFVMGRKRTEAKSLPSVELLFVSQKPGGPLLDKMIEAMGARPDQVEAVSGLHTLDEFKATIERVKPRVVVALGGVVAQNLLGNDAGIAELRGHVHAWGSAKLIATFHPDELLVNPAAKKESWSDLKIAMKVLGWKSKSEK